MGIVPGLGLFFRRKGGFPGVKGVKNSLNPFQKGPKGIKAFFNYYFSQRLLEIGSKGVPKGLKMGGQEFWEAKKFLENFFLGGSLGKLSRPRGEHSWRYRES